TEVRGAEVEADDIADGPGVPEGRLQAPRRGGLRAAVGPRHPERAACDRGHEALVVAGPGAERDPHIGLRDEAAHAAVADAQGAEAGDPLEAAGIAEPVRERRDRQRPREAVGEAVGEAASRREAPLERARRGLRARVIERRADRARADAESQADLPP